MLIKTPANRKWPPQVWLFFFRLRPSWTFYDVLLFYKSLWNESLQGKNLIYVLQPAAAGSVVRNFFLADFDVFGENPSLRYKSNIMAFLFFIVFSNIHLNTYSANIPMRWRIFVVKGEFFAQGCGIKLFFFNGNHTSAFPNYWNHGKQSVFICCAILCDLCPKCWHYLKILLQIGAKIKKNYIFFFFFC